MIEDVDDEILEESEVEEEVLEKEFDPRGEYSAEQLEEQADLLLRADANRELCRQCKEADLNDLPYGVETGEIESEPQYTPEGEPLVDEEGNQLYIDFPEMVCEKGHRWFKGEGARRDIRGPNPILFYSHLQGRKRREIMVESGIPDPAFTMDRFGRHTHGIYNRTRPDGRKVNDEKQRRDHGASFYR